MKAEDIRAQLDREPFVPFRLHLKTMIHFTKAFINICASQRLSQKKSISAKRTRRVLLHKRTRIGFCEFYEVLHQIHTTLQLFKRWTRDERMDRLLVQSQFPVNFLVSRSTTAGGLGMAESGIGPKKMSKNHAAFESDEVLSQVSRTEIPR